MSAYHGLPSRGGVRPGLGSVDIDGMRFTGPVVQSALFVLLPLGRCPCFEVSGCGVGVGALNLHVTAMMQQLSVVLSYVVAFGDLSAERGDRLGMLTPIVALPTPMVIPPLPTLCALSELFALATLLLLLRVCLVLFPSSELKGFDRDATLASPAPSIDADVCSVEEEEGGDMYLRFRAVLGEERFIDTFLVGKSCMRLFISGFMSLTSPYVGDDRSSSE